MKIVGAILRGALQVIGLVIHDAKLCWRRLGSTRPGLWLARIEYEGASGLSESEALRALAGERGWPPGLDRRLPGRWAEYFNRKEERERRQGGIFAAPQ